MAGKKDSGMFYMGNDSLPNKNWQGEYTPEKIAALKKAFKVNELKKHLKRNVNDTSGILKLIKIAQELKLT